MVNSNVRTAADEVEHANASGLTPVVFIHGLWLLPSSWDRWAAVFEAAGYTTVAPGWPDDPDTVADAKAHPEVFAHKTIGQVAEHVAEVIGNLKKKPAVIGHSFGGLLAQIAAGRGLSAATVAIDPAPFRGVLPLPFSALKAASPVLGNPANRNRAVPLTYAETQCGSDRDRRDAEPRACVGHRQRLARGRRQGPRFRQALRELTRGVAEPKLPPA